MTDTDKILEALQRLEAGQQAMQQDIKVLQVGQTELQGGQKALQEDVKALRGNVKVLQDGQKELQGGQKVLQADVNSLKEGQNTLELKVEAYHEEKKVANVEIITTLHDIISIDAKETDKRLTRIEKHLNLSPTK
jgi:predicted nuclease with TOPRIM domain